MSKLGWLAAAASVLVATSVFAGADNVVFPKDYKDTFQVVSVRDHHLGGNSVAVIWANKVAIDSVKKNDLDSGAIFLMEVWRAKTENNDLVRDAKGRLVRDAVTGINIMEKRTGWGGEYPAEWRNGNWEYATFTAEGAPRTGNLQGCFECHGPVGAAGYDFAYVVGEMREPNAAGAM
jgi:hypothetical protein